VETVVFGDVIVGTEISVIGMVVEETAVSFTAPVEIATRCSSNTAPILRSIFLRYL
jgi:hypothetical protein